MASLSPALMHGLYPEFGVYTYDVRASNDIRGHGWDTGVWIDGNTGAMRQVFLPSGQHAGNTVSTWLWGLHYGDIRDFLPYRILWHFSVLCLPCFPSLVSTSGGRSADTTTIRIAPSLS